MGLTEQINQDIKAAMLAKDKKKLESLRAIKSALLLAQTEKSGGEINEDTEIKILQKLVKQRKESADMYKSQNRQDLADDEEFQSAIIESYLPEQMSDDDVEAIVKKIISDTGAEGMKDMGKVMGLAVKEVAGRADNKIISNLVKTLLNN